MEISITPTPPKNKKRVGFSGEEEDARKPRPTSIVLPGGPPGITLSPPYASPPGLSPTESVFSTATHSRNTSSEALLPSIGRSHLPEISPEVEDQIRATLASPPIRPRPVLRRGDSTQSIKIDEEINSVTDRRAREAYERGKRLEHDERVQSAPTTRRHSPAPRSVSVMGPIASGSGGLRAGGKGAGRKTLATTDEIPLDDFARLTDDEDFENGNLLGFPPQTRGRGSVANIPREVTNEVSKLVQAHTMPSQHVFHNDGAGTLRSGAVTPIEERGPMFDYVPKPDRYRGGVLGSLLKLYNNPSTGEARSPIKTHFRQSSGGPSYDSAVTTPANSPPASGTSTPVGGRPSRWYSPKHHHGSSSSLAHLVGSSAMGASPVSGLGAEVAQRLQSQQFTEGLKRPSSKRSNSSKIFSNRLSRPRMEDQIRITIHIAETIARQRYLMKLCRALMLYGAPTHRLEEYMKMSARVLEIDAQFLYIPGSMIISFDDNTTHTTEVKLVKVAQGLDLGKLMDTHEVYKDVVHDRIGVEEATSRLDEVMKKPLRHSIWFLIPIYGLASASVGPFAFSATTYDLPISFILGCILGVLQLVVAPKSDLYANVFEVGAAVITSFLARAFGSIHGGKYFCFSALAQSSIALILPGYTVLCASLELQSRSIVAGSVRMVYAIIYSLFLGFGITIGTAIYGIMDTNASSETTCSRSMPHHYSFIAVPVFTMCLIVINQAKWRQAPVMVIIAFTGYIVNYYSSLRFSGNTQVSNTLGALAIGVMANMYSRLGARCENWLLDQWEDRVRPKINEWYKRLKGSRGAQLKHRLQGKAEEGMMHLETDSILVRRTRKVGYGLAAAAMLPAIFVQVPSGLAVSGSLVSGIAAANQISGNSTNGSTVVSATSYSIEGNINSIAFNVGFSVIQVAIGITVGLFLSAIVVYPLGKRRSGLFSF